MADVAAVIPALDEGPTIAEVVKGVRPLVATVIVVDDGSQDDTAAAAAAAGADVLRHERNQGKGTAIRTGLARALRGSCTHVLLMDGDLQHRPDEAARLIEMAHNSGADVVIGERVFDRRAMPGSRYWANRVGSRALSWFVGMPIQDTQCGFRVFRADLLRRLTLTATSYEIETEMLVKAGRAGARIARVPVSAVYGVSTSKLRPVRDTTRTCFLAVYYRFLERR